MKLVEHLVLLHGWGCDARIWQPLIEALQRSPQGEHGLCARGSVVVLELPGFGRNSAESWPDDESLLRQLYAQLPRNCLLIGHSLGGMLAARLAAMPEQEKIAGLIAIAANSSFVPRGDWPGMAAQTFIAFCESFAADPLNTWEKFCGLQARGDRDMRAALKQLKSIPPHAISSAWLDALDCLGRLDNRRLLAELRLPALHLFGEQDALVPAAAAEKFRELGAGVEILPGCGHAPQVSSPQLVAEKILGFVAGLRPASGAGGGRSRAPRSRRPQPPFEKSAVARSFGRAAASYDECAHLQRAVCRQLLNSADLPATPLRILDLGSGTGYGSALLRSRFPQAEIIALDIAEDMLRYARAGRPAADGYLAADAEQLPLADASFDLVFSSMALQWCYRLSQLFAELRRVLAPGGRLLVSTLGPGTLRELRDSWARVDDGVHVNRFLAADAWHSAARDSGLAGFPAVEQRVLHFDSALELMRELKNIGAHNVNSAAGRGLLGREKLRRLSEAYEQLRGEAGLPVSYEVIYLQLAQAGGKMTVGAAAGRDRYPG